MPTSTHTDRPVRIGVYSEVAAAKRAVSGLLAAGIPHEAITVICSDKSKQDVFKEFEHEQPAGAHTPSAIAAGGTLGALLAGLGFGATVLASGGLSLFVLPGVAAAGGVFGGLVGAMMTRGVEKSAANFYDQAIANNEILVAVELDEASDKGRLATAAGAKPLPMPEG